MNNDALVAALGLDAVAAVHGYRLAVLAEGHRRGASLVSEALSDVVPISSGVCVVIDPIDIRLTFVEHRSRPYLAGHTLTWNPSRGWFLFGPAPGDPQRFYAGPAAMPLNLVPTPMQVLDWAANPQTGTTAPPTGIDLDDDPDAISRLLGFVDPDHRVPCYDAFAPGSTPNGQSGAPATIAER
jgi:hypothetical protein